MLYNLRERLFFIKDIPLPQGVVVRYAKRSGNFMCYADKELYNMLQFQSATTFPLLPISQAPPPADGKALPVQPHILVVDDAEFLIVSSTGTGALGVFITGEGNPVRGTLEWPSYPKSVSLDFPYVTTLLANDTIEIHHIETQALVQVVPAPPELAPPFPGMPAEVQRAALATIYGKYLVPSAKITEKMHMKPVKLLRPPMDAKKEAEEVS